MSLARDFSRHPGPRLRSQGKHSGQEFRESVLVQALGKFDTITVDLDSTSGIGSSFIDEAFGGLIFVRGMDPIEVRDRVRVVSRLDESYLVEFEDSISRAQPPKR